MLITMYRALHLNLEMDASQYTHRRDLLKSCSALRIQNSHTADNAPSSFAQFLLCVSLSVCEHVQWCSGVNTNHLWSGLFVGTIGESYLASAVCMRFVGKTKIQLWELLITALESNVSPAALSQKEPM